MKRRVFLAAAGTATTASACSCVLTDPSDWPFPKEDGHSILFRGKLASRRPLPSVTGHKRYSATFNVHEYWRGAVSATVTIKVVISIGSGDCLQEGPGYLVGQEYLVYAYKNPTEPDSSYKDNAACVPVGLVKDFPKVMKALGTGRKPAV